MPRTPLLPLLVLPFLTACFGPGLAGDWEGDITCDGTTFDLEAELEADGGGEYDGDLVMSFYNSGTEDGVFYEIELEFIGGLVLETDGFGEQELDSDFELDQVRCRYFADGQLVTDDCDELGVDIDLGAGGDLGDLTWDGEDTIEIEDDDCEGELERD